LSPVFRHGSLRLYLLRLLDEEPRHGYEVIRLLRDRFMGVYSPSPGTIYPRLARLEEEGLVTHDEVDGRKVYRITEAGREELRSRSDELDELEDELSASVSDIVREVREDVRETVRSLREELTWAARESRRTGRDIGVDLRDQAKQARDEAREQARQARDEAREQVRQAREQAERARDGAREQARQARDEARGHTGRAREQAGRADDGTAGDDAARRVHERARRLREEAAARFRFSEQDWDTAGWANWGPGSGGWTDWPGRRGSEERARTRGGRGWAGPLDLGTIRDLERLAVQFTSDLRRLVMESSVAGENVISDLRVILEEALERVKTEIFGSAHEAGEHRDTDRAAADTGTAADTSSAADADTAADTSSAADTGSAAHTGGAADPGSTADTGGAADTSSAANTGGAPDPGSAAGTGSAANTGGAADPGSTAGQAATERARDTADAAEDTPPASDGTPQPGEASS
jgi:DNA-binding PadR family transcriptional regulator